MSFTFPSGKYFSGFLIVFTTWYSTGQHLPTASAIAADSTEKSARENYKVEIHLSKEPSHDFVNEDGFNLSYNTKKIRLYTAYDFAYNPVSPEGTIRYQINAQPEKVIETQKRLIRRRHHTTVNFDWDWNKKNTFSFNHSGSFYHDSFEDKITHASSEENLRSSDHFDQYFFAQSWRHSLSNSSQFELGFQEFYKKSNLHHRLNTENSPLYQSRHSKLPLLMGYTQLTQENKWGETQIRLAFQRAFNRDLLHNEEENVSSETIFKYGEKLLDLGLTQLFQLDSKNTLLLGARIEKVFKNLNTVEKKNATHGLYNLTYTYWATEKQSYKIKLAKTLKHPAYTQFNPNSQIDQDILFRTGDLELQSQSDYTLEFDTQQSNWYFALGFDYSKNFIEEFYAFKNERFYVKHTNFNKAYGMYSQLSYSNSLLKDRWESTVHLNWNTRRLQDANHEFHFSTVPQISLATQNQVDLGRNWIFGVDFSFSTTHSNRWIKRHGESKLDLFVEKRLNEKLVLSVFGEDIFSTHRKWDRIDSDVYSLSRNINLDTVTFGVSARYSITGKNYNGKKARNLKNNAAQRLR